MTMTCWHHLDLALHAVAAGLCLGLIVAIIRRWKRSAR